MLDTALCLPEASPPLIHATEEAGSTSAEHIYEESPPKTGVEGRAAGALGDDAGKPGSAKAPDPSHLPAFLVLI